MTNRRTIEIASEIMTEFADRTGLATDAGAPRRYLWTDAFAVCNLLELHCKSGEGTPLELALRLVEQVHATLGRHRSDDLRTGWISGLTEEEGRAHPTCAGLRIGKPRNERGSEEPADEGLEWDRDGQYFHYLTKWMHALARAARISGQERYLGWAIELARAAHAAFTHTPCEGARKRMFWKMSVDLTRPLVPSMGHHDPLDGLLTLCELRTLATGERWAAERASLDGPTDDMLSMCEGVSWATADPLGLGGVLCDAYRLAQLHASGCPVDAGDAGDPGLLAQLMRDSAAGLFALTRSGALDGPASGRLAFRELGLAIGLEAVPRLGELVEREGAGDRREVARELEVLRQFVPLGLALEEFWLNPANQATESWSAHVDIDTVMLATSLIPDGFLTA